MDVPERIEVEGRHRIVLAWPDGTSTSVGAAGLRAACPCAVCRELSGAAATARVLAGDEPVAISAVRLVGSYAVHVTFEPDGHATGIFPFDLLRSLEA